MTYINMSVSNKRNRNVQINNDLGPISFLMIYSGSYPLSPDIAVPPSNLLVALPCSNPFGTLTYVVQDASVNNGGNGGTPGFQTVTGVNGTGAKFQALVNISGTGSITSVVSITYAGSYSVLPIDLYAESVTGAGLSNATLSLAMTSILTANAITHATAVATGTAGFARLATSNAAGNSGVIDLDVGGSVIINTATIVVGNDIVATSAIISEA